METQEYLDIVDENDRVITKMTIEDAYKQSIGNIRWVCLMIRNDEGKLWIPRRLLTKSKFPWALDYSVWGHVSSWETYVDGLIREAQEEICMILDRTELNYIGKIVQDDDIYHIRFFAEIYEYITNTPPGINKNEHSTSYWFTPDELYAKLLNPDEPPYKTGLKEVLEKFYLIH